MAVAFSTSGRSPLGLLQTVGFKTFRIPSHKLSFLVSQLGSSRGSSLARDGLSGRVARQAMGRGRISVATAGQMTDPCLPEYSFLGLSVAWFRLGVRRVLFAALVGKRRRMGGDGSSTWAQEGRHWLVLFFPLANEQDIRAQNSRKIHIRSTPVSVCSPHCSLFKAGPQYARSIWPASVNHELRHPMGQMLKSLCGVVRWQKEPPFFDAGLNASLNAGHKQSWARPSHRKFLYGTHLNS